MKYQYKHHYGWVDGEDKPYQHLRKTHTFLTDDNHIWKDTGESIVVYRNENSPELSNLTPTWARAKSGDYWLDLPYKEIYDPQS